MRPISLKAARIDCGLNQTQLAEKLGISLQTMKNYEQGKHRVPLETAIKISEILGFELFEIKFF